MIRSRLNRLLHQWKHGKKVFLIYTMGKVGSTTIYTQLRKKYPYFPVFHLHFLSDEWLHKRLPAMHSFFHANIKQGEHVLQQLDKLKDHRIKIVTLVREPMVREISDIFQNWKGLFDVTSIHDIAPEKFREHLDKHDHDYVLNWFDTEFKSYTGFDIYSKPFDKQKGYSIYSTPRFDILCIQLEKLNDVLPEAMKAFADVELDNGVASNTSETKESKELYRALVSTYKMTESRAEQLYASKYVQHFYSADDIQRFKSRWTGTKA